VAEQQIRRRCKMRFVRPFLPRQAAREEAFADICNVGV
jgi:hypothetical protein